MVAEPEEEAPPVAAMPWDHRPCLLGMRCLVYSSGCVRDLLEEEEIVLKLGLEQVAALAVFMGGDDDPRWAGPCETRGAPPMAR